MAKNYDALADSVVELVGGKDNVRSVVHCITRLRFNLKDKSTIRGLMLVYRELGTRTARPRRRRGNQSPGRALISARVPTVRNVYRG